jgi:hypothetical protein
VEARVLQQLIRPDLSGLDHLSDDELNDLERLSRKACCMKAESSITDLVDEQATASNQEHKPAPLPKSVVTLSVFLRHETTLMNMLIKSLGLLRTLQADRVKAETELTTINARPSEALGVGGRKVIEPK